MVAVVVVVGNPKAKSRTWSVANFIAGAVVDALDIDADLSVIDLADVGGELLDRDSPRVAALIEQVTNADLLVVASPTYKATYTGLLKIFLDRFAAESLQSTVAVPVMVGAGPGHSLAVEVHLRPLLVELGASMPTKGVFVLEEDADRLADALAGWLEGEIPRVARALQG